MRKSEPCTATRQLAQEYIASGSGSPAPDMLPAIELREFVSARCGATGLSTGTATFAPAAVLPYHLHRFSEAITILEGIALVAVEGRTYRMYPLDCIHLPAGTAHRVSNASSEQCLKAHWSFATNEPSRELVEDRFAEVYVGDGKAVSGSPEHVMRFAGLQPYELANGTRFYDLFAGRFGSEGICGGYGEFDSGAGLPCHTHNYDESITIVQGKAICSVQGRRYTLSDCDTALVPRGRPHRFVNAGDDAMAMI
ncbi:MAG: cupin domain-containing protein, partial [Bryobacteraceae bacterium]